MEELDAMKLPVFLAWILVKVCKTGILSVRQMSSLDGTFTSTQTQFVVYALLRVIGTFNLNRP